MQRIHPAETDILPLAGIFDFWRNPDVPDEDPDAASARAVATGEGRPICAACNRKSRNVNHLDRLVRRILAVSPAANVDRVRQILERAEKAPSSDIDLR